MAGISELVEYVVKHSERGTCRCCRCIDHPGTDKQPEGHTADVVFFLVSSNEADAEKLRALVQAATKGEYCNVDMFDGKEHGYIELGGWIGDQGLALRLMGLGSVLGLWTLMTPKILPGLPDEMVNQLVGAGMVTVQSC